jgi:hypothetical protein
MEKLNLHFRIVFTPKNPNYYPNKRFLVSPNQLFKYIGSKNANKAILEAFESLQVKTIKKYRKYGKIEIYSK